MLRIILDIVVSHGDTYRSSYCYYCHRCWCIHGPVVLVVLVLVLVLVVLVVGVDVFFVRGTTTIFHLSFALFFLVRGACRGDGRRRPARENGLQPLQDNGIGGARRSGLLRGE